MQVAGPSVGIAGRTIVLVQRLLIIAITKPQTVARSTKRRQGTDMNTITNEDDGRETRVDVPERQAACECTLQRGYVCARGGAGTSGTTTPSFLGHALLVAKNGRSFVAKPFASKLYVLIVFAQEREALLLSGRRRSIRL